MAWPLSQDYNESIQTPAQCFTDAELRRGEAITNNMGMPEPCSGNFADVYPVQAGQKKWAVKCFTRQIQGLRERYVEISKYLPQVQLPFMVDFKFLEQGIRVRSQWYPIVKMQWVEGQTLNSFVKGQLGNPPLLRTASQMWARMGTVLREANLAHGDLQHGNVLLVPGSKAGTVGLKLVDYDGMCVPALEFLKATEVGHPAYQHPQRLREGTYGLHIDRFSHLVIYTALRALTVGGRNLWEKFDNGDNLLFVQEDFEKPHGSAVFQDLLKLADPEVKKLVQALAAACQKPVAQTPLLDDLVSVEKPTKKKTAAVTGTPSPENVFASATASGSSTLPRRQKGKRRIGLMVGAAVALAAVVVSGVLLLGGNGGPQSSKSDVAVANTGKQKSARSTELKSEPKRGPRATELAADLAEDMEQYLNNDLRGHAEEFVRRVGPSRIATWRAAANRGVPEGQYLLGNCYQAGIGVPKNEAEAANWYRKAADQGLPRRQCDLGSFSLEGIGVRKDEAEAIKWYRKAAKQGFANAQIMLGFCYQRGRGVPKDDAEAVNWYRRAAAQGFASTNPILASASMMESV